MGFRFDRILKRLPDHWINMGKYGVGAFALILATGLTTYTQHDRIKALLGASEVTTVTTQATLLQPAKTENTKAAPVAASGTRYVSRTNSVMRDAPKPSAKTLKKYRRGAAVTLLELAGDWAKVRDGNMMGWMRVSVLRETPPPTTK
jgi:hypothetical protein